MTTPGPTKPPRSALRGLRFTKGHGTENDFLLVPALDGEHDLTAADVRALCDRRAGIGGDGVIRVVPVAAATEEHVRAQSSGARWFMDYRNADGGAAEMCGNGTRVFAAYLRREGLETADEFAIATRAGLKTVTFEKDDAGEDLIAVNLGDWRLVDPAGAAERGFDAMVQLRGRDDMVQLRGRDDMVQPRGHDAMPGLRLDLGNPHVVVALPDEIELEHLDLSEPPTVNPVPAQGVNVELVRPLAPGHVEMRVHERGVGETRSCGTGAAAAALATRFWAGGSMDDLIWRVDVPGGSLRVRALVGQQVELAGPARLVADGLLCDLGGD